MLAHIDGSRNGRKQIIARLDDREYFLEGSPRINASDIKDVWLKKLSHGKNAVNYVLLCALNPTEEEMGEISDITKHMDAKDIVRHKLYPLALYPLNMASKIPHEDRKEILKRSLDSLPLYINEYLTQVQKKFGFLFTGIAFYDPSDGSRLVTLVPLDSKKEFESNLPGTGIESVISQEPLEGHTYPYSLQVRSVGRRGKQKDFRLRLLANSYHEGVLFMPVGEIFQGDIIPKEIAEALYKVKIPQ